MNLIASSFGLLSARFRLMFFIDLYTAQTHKHLYARTHGARNSWTNLVRFARSHHIEIDFVGCNWMQI